MRRVDEDRWLASRFAPGRARARLIGLYAVAYEIARTSEVVSDPILGAIRLQWWRDRIEGLREGAAAEPQPALQRLQDTGGAGRRGLFEAMIEARAADFETAPFATWEAIEAYVDATAGGLIVLAAEACAPDREVHPEAEVALRAAGKAWGFVGLTRAAPSWAARGRTPYPAEALRRGSPEQAREALITRAEGALRDARRAARILPAEMFPAVGYVTLAHGYADALRRGAADPGPMARRLRLLAAAATGRL